MRTLFHRFTWHDFSRGWPIFWRMNLPFWVDLFHIGLSVALALALSERAAVENFWNRWPGWAVHPWARESILALGIYLGLWPVFWGMKKSIHQWADSAFWLSQFALVSGVRKLSRWLAALLVAFLMLLWGLPGEGFLQIAAVRGGLALCACLLFTALVLSVGLYGWLAAQWGELGGGKR